MNEKPEALRLAELLEEAMTVLDEPFYHNAIAKGCDKAAAELRRLHEENERLREECDELGRDKGTWYRMAELHCATIDRLKTSMLEAVKAEREACAEIVDANANVCANNSMLQDVLRGNAAAIRARGEQEQPR